MAARSEQARALLIAAVLVLPPVLLHGAARAGARWAAWPEQKALDLDYRIRGALRRPPPPDDSVRLVLEDDEADEAAGRYTSSWEFLRAVLERLDADRPRAIFVDYQFLSGVSVTWAIGDDLLAAKARASARGGIDAALAADLDRLSERLRIREPFLATLKRTPVVLPLLCEEAVSSDTPETPALLAQAGGFADRTTPAWFFGTLRFPDPAFASAAQALTQACEAADGDGILRRWMVVVATESGGRRLLLPSAPVTMARIALGLPPDAVHVDGGALAVGDRRVPLDADGSALLDFNGAAGAFRARARQGRPIVFSASALLAEGTLRPGTFTDKVVFFGPAERASPDLKRTPFSYQAAVPGVETLALATTSVLDARYPLVRPPLLARFGFVLTILIAALGALCGLFLPLPRGAGAVLLIAGGPLLLLLGGALLFTFAGVWADSAYPALAWSLAVVGGGFERFRKQTAERRLLESAFKLYLAPEMVDLVLRNPERLRLEGQERELTILFSDLRGFTSRSERLPATEMVALLNEHLTAMHRVVVENGGTLDKFIGDCVMAFWGAPSEDARHAVNACLAGQRMLEVLAEQNRARAAAGREQLDVGVGICTGRVIVGNMGSAQRFDYTVIGDAVNLASRLEGLTKDAGYGVLIGERTRELVGDALPLDELGPMKVKGKAAAVRVFGLATTRRAAPKTSAAG